MTTHTGADIKGALLTQEQTYLKAIEQKDGATIANLTDRTSLIAGPQGLQTLDVKAIQAMVQQHDASNRYEIVESTIQTLPLTDDVAVMGYKLRTIPPDGPPTEAYNTDVWVNRNDRWLCAMHTEVPAGNR
jgi:hypothetical protein